MPSITVSSGITNVIGLFSGALDETFEDGTVTGFSTTSITVAIASGIVTVTGDSFAPDGMGGFTGNIDSIITTFSNGETISWTNVGLTVTQLLDVYALENNQPFDIDAIENLLLPLGWDVSTNDNDDVLTSQTTSTDGVKLHFTGDDRFDLKGGDDNWFASDGKDTIFGGTAMTHSTVAGAMTGSSAKTEATCWSATRAVTSSRAARAKTPSTAAPAATTCKAG